MGGKAAAMIKSMTGYGRGEVTFAGASVTAELLLGVFGIHESWAPWRASYYRKVLARFGSSPSHIMSDVIRAAERRVIDCLQAR